MAVDKNLFLYDSADGKNSCLREFICDGLIPTFGEELKMHEHWPERYELLFLQKFLRLIK